jgi:hypothetical protein
MDGPETVPRNRSSGPGEDGPSSGSPGQAVTTPGQDRQPGASSDALLAVAANLSRCHREHEKYYSEAPLADAIALQRTARTLIALAERWTTTEPARTPAASPFAGTLDLNDDRETRCYRSPSVCVACRSLTSRSPPSHDCPSHRYATSLSSGPSDSAAVNAGRLAGARGDRLGLSPRGSHRNCPHMPRAYSGTSRYPSPGTPGRWGSPAQPAAAPAGRRCHSFSQRLVNLLDQSRKSPRGPQWPQIQGP